MGIEDSNTEPYLCVPDLFQLEFPLNFWIKGSEELAEGLNEQETES